MIRIYGSNISRAQRCLWMLHELDVPFEHIATGFGADSKAPEYMALNPNGRVPTLVDGDLVLWESVAINLYLSKKYPSELGAKTLEEEAHLLKWSLWGVTAIEHACIDLLFHRRLLPEAQRVEATAVAAAEALGRPLPVLDAVLASSPYLLGDRFTVADLNVAAMLGPAKIGGFSLAAYPNVDRWFRACIGRPANKKSTGRA
jgi:glutathione S-transferase